MNKAIIGILLVLLLANCQRDEVENRLVGTWRWEETGTGDFVYLIHKPKKGENTYLTFSKNQTFEVTLNDTLFVTGKYRMAKTKIGSSDQIFESIRFENMVFSQQATDPNSRNFVFLADLMLIRELTSSHLFVIYDNRYQYNSSFVRR